MEILGKINDEERKVVEALLMELRKSEMAVKSYVNHVLKEHGFDGEKHALAQDLTSVVPMPKMMPPKPLSKGAE